MILRTRMSMVVALLLVPHLTTAQKLPAIPAPTQIDADNLNLATRAAVVCGVQYLLSDVETNETGYLIPPLTVRTVKSYQEKIPIEVRFKKVTVPIKKPVYEKYETMGTVKEGHSTDATRKIQKVTRQRIVGWEDTGKTEERLVEDKNGPIVQTRYQYKNPIYENKITWPKNFLGLNAMALYAILKSGQVEQSGAVKTAIRTLNGDLTMRGIPDTTFDLAWLAAAFSLIQDKEFHTHRDRIISKLTDAQIVEGPGRGLWGPVAIRTDLLAAMIAHERNLADRWDKAKAKLKESPDNKSRQRAAQDAESAFKAFQTQYKPVTMQGLRFLKCTESLVIGLSQEDTITIPGLPYYFYTQALGDIENTALALFALREAAENNCLPKSVWRPMGSAGTPILQPETPEIILARAANALAARQKEDGSWDQGNIHQPITAFAPFGFPPMPADEIFSLPSPVTPLSSLQGYNGLVAAGQIVGMNKLAGKFQKQLDGARQNRLKIAESFVANPNQTGAMGPGHPYDLYLQMATLHRLPGALEEERRELWAQIAVQAVNLQKDDGGWNTPDVIALSPSLIEFLTLCAEENRSIHYEKRVGKKEKDFNAAAYRKRLAASRGNQMEGRAYSTAAALIFLMGGLREPVLGSLAIGTASASSQIPTFAIQLFNRNRSGLPDPLIRVSLDTPSTFINRLPVLYVETGAEPLDPMALEVIKRYVSGPGFLVIGQPVSTPSDFSGQWTALIPGAKTGKVPATSSLLKGATPIPADKLTGLYGAEGQLTGVLLKVDPAAAPTGPALSGAQAATCLALAIREYQPKEAADSRLIPVGEDPFVVRVGAVDLLNARQFDRSKLTTAPPPPAPAPDVPASAPSAAPPNPIEEKSPAPLPPTSPTAESSGSESSETPAALAPAVGQQNDEKW